MKRLFVITIFILSACAPLAPTVAPVLPTVTAIPSPTTFPQTTATPSPIPDTLFVDPSVSLGPISPLIFGSNYGPWLTVPFYNLQQAYDSGIKILRFPAGAWGDHNDVTHMQIDQFMDFANKLGATAIFQVRLLDGTPEQAAEMVLYTNVEKSITFNTGPWEMNRRNIMPIGDQTEVQANMWLFDPDHKAENIGSVELSGGITIPLSRSHSMLSSIEPKLSPSFKLLLTFFKESVG